MSVFGWCPPAVDPLFSVFLCTLKKPWLSVFSKNKGYEEFVPEEEAKGVQGNSPASHRRRRSVFFKLMLYWLRERARHC